MLELEAMDEEHDRVKAEWGLIAAFEPGDGQALLTFHATDAV